MDKQTEVQTDGVTTGWTDRQLGGRRKREQTEGQREGYEYRVTETGLQTDGRTDRQADTLTGININRALFQF
jgi:hypothetical protein